MDLTKDALFKLMDTRMDYLGERTRVLAQNISNADTPGYRSIEMRHVDFIQALHREAHMMQPTMTNAAHLPPVTPQNRFEIDRQKRPYETSPDKNGVVIEEQAGKLAQTAGDFSTTTALYGKYLTMIKLAVK